MGSAHGKVVSLLSECGCHGSPRKRLACQSWESELLEMSLELQRKLEDPRFVAQRCDLDGSGDLDPHELKQAIRAFGTKLSDEDLEELMEGEERLSMDRFVQIVAALRGEASPLGLSARSAPCAVPHSLRGMALGQLERLEEVFVKSGWLGEQCESFNQLNEEAIRQGSKYPQAENLYAMNTFVVTPMTRPGTCKARDQDSRFEAAVSQANWEMSFSELLNPHGLMVHSFVSHYWGHIFEKTIAALRLWAEEHFSSLPSGWPQSVVYWICLFALNQHAVAEEVGESPKQGPFNAALAQASAGAVMVLDEEINPFRRIWCLFEVSRLAELHRPLELISELGSLSRPAEGIPHVQKTLRAAGEALWDMSASEALASDEEDKFRIWREILDPSEQRLCDFENRTFDLWEFFEQTDPEERKKMFSQFDAHVQSLLSTSMLQLLLRHGSHEEAAKCCTFGGRFSKENLAEIYANGVPVSRRTSWLNEAMQSSVKHGHVEETQLLLQTKADVAATDNHGGTALMHAAFYGHTAVGKLLLDSCAHVAAEDEDGTSVLLFAVAGGHTEMAKLLLERGADAAVQDGSGWSALAMCAERLDGVMAQVLLQSTTTAATAERIHKHLEEKFQGQVPSMMMALHMADASYREKISVLIAAWGGYEAAEQQVADMEGEDT
ncbi:unnamed protein product [Durusdinium trenchii]